MRALGTSMKEVESSNQSSFDFLQAARTHDPETSHEAAEKVTASGKRETDCNIVLAVLKDRTGLTTKEIAQRCSLTYHQVARRMIDLEHSNLIFRGAPKMCSIGAVSVLSWWVK